MAIPTPPVRRMNETDKLLALLAEARKRHVASVMGLAERSGYWKKLNPVERKELRDHHIGEFDVFYNLVRDVIKVDRSSDIRNPETVDLLVLIHEQVNRMHAANQALLAKINEE